MSKQNEMLNAAKTVTDKLQAIGVQDIEPITEGPEAEAQARALFDMVDACEFRFAIGKSLDALGAALDQ